MKAVLVASARSEHQNKWATSFGRGLRKHGWDVKIASRPSPADLLVLWGVRARDRIEKQKKAGGEVCILERGYLGDRFSWTSVSFGGGLNGHGRFYGPFDDSSRFNANFTMRDWQDRKGYALILGQVPRDMSLDGLEPEHIWQSAYKKLSDQGWDVRFRPHPLAPQVNIGAMPAGGTLEDALAGAAFVVTINSNSGVDAVINGVPTVALDDRSMAWSVSGHTVSPPPMPDRARWASGLAWCQYTSDEMESGFCWDQVKHAVD